MRLFKRIMRRREEGDGRSNSVRPAPVPAPVRVVHALVPGAAPVALPARDPDLGEFDAESDLQQKRWFVENVQADWQMVDVGAGVGIFTVLAARGAPGGAVYAFEAAASISGLRRNVDAAGLVSVELHMMRPEGRSDATGDWPLYAQDRGADGLSYEFATLDAFSSARGIGRLDCIRLGAGDDLLSTLRGARETLRRFDPWLIVELAGTSRGGDRPATAVLRELMEQGYRSGFVMDQGSILLRRECGGVLRESNSEAMGELSLSFDRRPVMLLPAFGPGEKLPHAFSGDLVLHNGATREVEAGVPLIEMIPLKWSLAASLDAGSTVLPDGPIVCDVVAEVLEGAVGIAFMNATYDEVAGKEALVEMTGEPQHLRIFSSDASKVSFLTLRNLAAHGGRSRVRLLSVAAASAIPVAPERISILEPTVVSVDLAEVQAGLSGQAPVNHTSSVDRNVRIVGVEALGEALGIREPFIPEKTVYRYGIEDFKTEVDEAAIFSYLYRGLAPKRHLEFGTWEGWGALLCAKSCDAEIWTVNLPDGERDMSGEPKYSEVGAPTDSGSSIGWRYREKGYGRRVHQILCDSRELPVAQFGAGFFDTILIDGGHTPDVVASDTEKALALARSGGVIVWHDFCPDAGTLCRAKAARGVFAAIHDHFAVWRPQLRDMFWVRPSWLLIGIKA